ncbi:MAG: hypothetical protein CMO55_17970 [Verrucomicrobiales bacterium]|nr:hypothetical protein [Verrucomicrobiales bacterium]
MVGKLSSSNMNRIFLTAFVLIAAVTIPVPRAEAGRVSQKAFRKFKGVYSGVLSGIYGETNGSFIPLAPISFPADVRISSRRKSSVVSGTGNVHIIRYSRPMGSKRRVKIRGIYIGSFFNPVSGFSEPVTGGQRITITDKGRGKRFRFNMRFGDVLQEGSLSYQRVNGIMKKAK